MIFMLNIKVMAVNIFKARNKQGMLAQELIPLKEIERKTII